MGNAHAIQAAAKSIIRLALAVHDVRQMDGVTPDLPRNNGYTETTFRSNSLNRRFICRFLAHIFLQSVSSIWYNVAMLVLTTNTL